MLFAYCRKFMALFLVAGCFFATGRNARAQSQSAPPTDEQIDKLIKDLQEALFTFQVDEWAILKGTKTKEGAIAAPPDVKDGKEVKPLPEMYKTVIPTGTVYEATDASGKVTKIDKGEVYFLQPPGHFQPDFYRQSNPGGFSTMAVWGLVASDFPNEDPRMQKVLNSFFEGTCPRGTYTLSFRLNILSHLIRWRDPRATAGYKKYLDRETDTLVKASRESGQYTYQAYPPHGFSESPPDSWTWKGKSPPVGGDNSNTQFGPFGVSASEDALIEVEQAFWLKQQEWWEKCQFQDGHWSYFDANKDHILHSNINMTDAGMNSLYLVIDKFYSRQAGVGYKPLKGFTYTPEAYGKMQKIFARLDKGFAWMDAQDALKQGHAGNAGYYQYGLQRLGLNCGRKYIGPRFWYERVVESAYQNGTVRGNGAGGDIQSLAWRLMCLAFGRAPVFFNKLDTGEDSDWNYYVRDVAHLTDWLGQQMEKRINWQTVELRHTLHDFQDAPILIISGEKKLELSEDAQRKLKDYCDFGGTIFLHPNHDSKEFKESAKKLFTEMYKKEGYEFSELPKDHPVYLGPGGKGAKSNTRVTKVTLQAMSDGGRQFVFLCNGDIAGAWQLMLYKTFNDAFALMLNLRLYAAPIYQDLPGRLRPRLGPVGPGPNKVVIARIKHSGHSTANPRLYEAMQRNLHLAGYNVEVRDQVVPDAASLAGVNVIHVTGHNNYTLPPEQVAEIKKALEKGAFLLLDPAYGRKAAADANLTLVKQLGLEAEDMLLSDHKLLKNIASFKPNHWAIGQLPRAFKELQLDDKPVGMLSTLDLTAVGSGDYVYGNPAISTDAARQLWINLVAHATKTTPLTGTLVPPATPVPTPAPKPTVAPTATAGAKTSPVSQPAATPTPEKKK